MTQVFCLYLPVMYSNKFNWLSFAVFSTACPHKYENIPLAYILFCASHGITSIVIHFTSLVSTRCPDLKKKNKKVCLLSAYLFLFRKHYPFVPNSVFVFGSVASLWVVTADKKRKKKTSVFTSK